MRLVAVGDLCSNNNDILHSYFFKEIPQYIPAIFENKETIIEIDQQVVSLHLFNINGHQEFHHLRPLAYQNIDIVLITFSVIEESSFENVFKKWYPEVSKFCPDAVIIVMGSQIDLRDKQPNNPKYIYEKDARERLKNINCFYHEWSLQTRGKLKELFETAVREVLKRNKITNASKQKKAADSQCQIM